MKRAHVDLLMIFGFAVAISLIALAGCGGADTQTAPTLRTDANGDLRYGQLRFKPCSLGDEGMVAIEATVRVPIRFRLKPLRRGRRNRRNCKESSHR